MLLSWALEKNVLVLFFPGARARAAKKLNAHGILLFMIQCRELGKPELFLVDLTGSQDCESSFRALRSMSSTFYTVVNFDVKEVLERAKRIQATARIMKNVQDFEFARNERKKKSFVPDVLLNDDEINEVVTTGWIDVKGMFESLGKKEIIPQLFPCMC